MLVGRAEGLDGGEALEDLGAVGGVALAEALGPELAEPVGEEVEPVAVGHEDVHGLGLS